MIRKKKPGESVKAKKTGQLYVWQYKTHGRQKGEQEYLDPDNNAQHALFVRRGSVKPAEQAKE